MSTQTRWQNRDRRTHLGKGGGHVPPYWTRERCLEALAAHVASTTGPLPIARYYNDMKKGRDLPTERKCAEVFGSVEKAWIAAGAPPERVVIKNRDWTQEDNDRLILMAGNRTLAQIGKALGRTGAACKRQMYDLGITNRNGAEYMSVQQVATQVGCDPGRVSKLIADGRLRATKRRKVSNRWDIDPMDITREIKAELMKPKVHKPEAQWPHEMIERVIRMRDGGLTWHEIGVALNRNYNATCRRYYLVYQRRPKWRAVWYVCKEFGGTASGLDIVRVMEGRGHRVKYQELAAMARAHPDKLVFKGGVVSLVGWTSKRVRPWQKTARAA